MVGTSQDLLTMNCGRSSSHALWRRSNQRRNSQYHHGQHHLDNPGLGAARPLPDLRGRPEQRILVEPSMRQARHHGAHPPLPTLRNRRWEGLGHLDASRHPPPAGGGVAGSSERCNTCLIGEMDEWMVRRVLGCLRAWPMRIAGGCAGPGGPRMCRRWGPG